ncbi:MAG: penicillin-binding protein transpeptidase [Clostridia bacterium]|nr:penicillin-binding protein transpeptidase [Clostridia bacterium]
MDDVNKTLTENQEAYKLTIVQKRLKALGILFLLFFAAIVVKLFWIQVVRGESYLTRAADQRQYVFQSSVARGQIFDRNMIPFTDRELKKFIAVTEYVTDKSATAEVVGRAAGVSKEEVLALMKDTSQPIELKAKDFSNKDIESIEKGMVKGVSILEKKIRYSEESLARHVIGYIGKSDLNGVMGIEKSMNNILVQDGGERIVAIVDSHKNVIPSLGFRKVETNGENVKLGIKLTLDFHIQKIVEDVLKENEINGSAVIMDIKSGDILAMASTPDFEPNNVGNYLNSKNDELINKAIAAYDLGSIFKTIVAAAAIENNIIEEGETFICEGQIESNNKVIKCATHSSHDNRPITFEEAFALSCNTTFVKVGTRVGADKILEMAKRMGFSEKQCSELLEEKPGYLPTVREEGIGNISIGQGKIQVTPLQVTTMMATIANNGIKNMPSIVDSVVDSDSGTTIQTMSRSKPAMVLNTSTVSPLKEMLQAVTTEGTGKQANMDDFGGSSGKTSSAETGIKSGDVLHGWFAGFVPSDKPQYAITVFVYDGKSGGKAAAPIFKKIAYRIFTEYKPVN